MKSNDAAGKIDFVLPPLGGAAAEAPFVHAIQQMEGQPTFTIPTAELTAPLRHTTCKSYTDADLP